MGKIRFEERSHTYWNGSFEIPSVTAIIAAAGLMPDYSFATTEKGTSIHEVTANWDREAKEDLDFPAVARDFGLQPFLDAWIKFRIEMKYAIGEIQEIEEPVYNEILGYAGTPDRVFKNAVVEIKSYDPDPWVRLQTIAYLDALPEKKGRTRIVAILMADGRFQIQKHPNSYRDRDIFRSALVCAHYQIGKYGRLRK